ncbi:MAG: class I SAM-dependent methyltransferase [Planctomycetota bacterium]
MSERDNQSQSKSGLNREQIHLLVSNRLSQFRHLAWEDDLSRNSIDDLPFENLPPISELLKTVDRIPNAKISMDEIRSFAANDSAPIPCPDDRERYSLHHNEQYWYSGLNDYLTVLEATKRHGLEVKKFFDFGCASGRVIRHFVAQTEIDEIWGSDINARHIRWLCEFMPSRVKPIANCAIPNLPLADHQFDLVTAFSVFTHIDTFETCWLAELKRILRPGGLAYLTIHNEDTWSQLGKEIDNEKNRLVQSLIEMEPNVKEQLKDSMPEGKKIYRLTHLGPYRAQVFHSNRYIENVWGRFFDIVEILPCHHVRQSVVILRA